MLDELDEIDADVLERSPRVRRSCWPRRVPTAEKDRILTETSRAGPAAWSSAFLRVLNRHGRLGLLAPIVREARADLGPAAEPPIPVLVRSAVAARRGPAAGASATGSPACSPATPVLTSSTDPALIGGLVVQVGDDVYDASVRNRLATASPSTDRREDA